MLTGYDLVIVLQGFPQFLNETRAESGVVRIWFLAEAQNGLFGGCEPALRFSQFFGVGHALRMAWHGAGRKGRRV